MRYDGKKSAMCTILIQQEKGVLTMSGKENVNQACTNQQEHIGTLYEQSTDKAVTYICERIEGQIAYYEAKSTRNKKLYHVLSALAIVANAMVPVCSVFLETADGNDGLKFIIAFLSSCALVATSLLVLFNAKELWNKYRRSAMGLTALLHQYYARTGVFEQMGEQEAFRLLSRMAESILDEENKDWSALLQNSTKTGGTVH